MLNDNRNFNNDDFMNDDINRLFNNSNNKSNKIKTGNPILGCGLFLYSIGIISFVAISVLQSSVKFNQNIDINSFELTKIAFRYTLYELIVFILPFIIVKIVPQGICVTACNIISLNEVYSDYYRVIFLILLIFFLNIQVTHQLSYI